MASSSDVVKKVMRFKLQLTDTAEAATVLKTLQKLKDLDITLDILAETGIGKTVNSLRRHEQAGEFAKALVRGWKRLVPKESTSHTEDSQLSETPCAKDSVGDCSNNANLKMKDLNNNCLLSHNKSPVLFSSSNEAVFKPDHRKADSEKQRREVKIPLDQNENQEKYQQESPNINQNGVLKRKAEAPEDKMDNSVVSKKKKGQRNRKSGDCDSLSEDTQQTFRSESTEKLNNSDRGRFEHEKESNKKPKTSNSSKDGKESFSAESRGKYSKTLKLVNVAHDRSSGVSKSSEAQNEERKKTVREKHALKHTHESENEDGSRHKKVKMKHEDRESDSGPAQPSMSFESYLNYDVNVFKRREKSRVRKPSKKIKTVAKEEARRDCEIKNVKSPVMAVNDSSPKQKFLMDLMSIPLPASLPECEQPSSLEYSGRRVEKESDFCDIPEESAVFTGQRLNRKMQVYSGAKTVFLPTMMSLLQQCIRTLQNNINLLYETGGVPFEILEPVLERCTPEQLLRIEECNPIYVGITDHLWGKHCQRDFKDSKLQEYESWKEMYVRLSEERERKLQRLTKSIVTAHSKKPKGRQVKMAFIHTVAKPPRDVRIQQEIHGTAVQHPHQLRCSTKVQENRLRPSCNEPSRSSSTSSGANSAQDPRKKTRVAPMMAKSLKAFKKQLGRR